MKKEEKVFLERVKSKAINRYEPGTAKYYRDALENISGTLVDYDGYNTKSAKQMKELVDDVKEQAGKALTHKKLYLTTA